MSSARNWTRRSAPLSCSDLQKELALQMPVVPWPGAANGYTLAWPHLANFSVWVPRSAQTPMIEVWPKYWYDETKKT